ncbi:MAG TPA: nickel pincer cofactor biosynthesis protein LarC [Candidatus Kapabacteria bacterium]|jgi:hypothetical protein|nr:nickel pincer cofactor biosynthesis protein LarC [Candidatus Kapabacteria bacterium]
MRIAYFDCFAGLSGDMTVGALISAGLPLEYLTHELTKLPLAGYRVSTRLVERSMISAVKFDVEIGTHEHSHHHHDRHHDHFGHHDHTETHVHSHGLSYHEIQHVIGESDLAERVKLLSLEIFRHIGIAEARIHNVPIEKVHFHEVGAVDSIVDIVSVAIGLVYFEVEECRSRAVPLGAGGFIHTAHGVMPVPAPATIAILEGYPTELGMVESELTTPTGAGIIRATSTGLLRREEELSPIAIGYGAGTKEFREIPNLLRIVIGELNTDRAMQSEHGISAFPKTDWVVQLTTAIDDMPPTALAYVQSQLMEAGALDVYLRPIIMKKGRAGHEMVVLASETAAEQMLNILARETTTLGIRYERIRRHIADREHVEVEHEDFGSVHAKRISHGSFSRMEFEYEDVKRIALENSLPLREVYDRLKSCIKSRKTES